MPNQDRISKDLSGIHELPSGRSGINELPSNKSVIYSQQKSGSMNSGIGIGPNMSPSGHRKNKSKMSILNRKSSSSPNSGDDQVKTAVQKEGSDPLSCDTIPLLTSPPKGRNSSITNQVNLTVGPQSIDENQSTPKKDFRFGGTLTPDLENFCKNHRLDGHAVESVKYVRVTDYSGNRKGSSFSKDRMGKSDLEKHHLNHNQKRHLGHSSSSIYYGK